MYLSAERKERILMPVLVVQAGYQLQQEAQAREALEFIEDTDIVKVWDGSYWINNECA
jgi:hypothetical protein